MQTNLRVVLAQLNFTVGDIDGNCKKMLSAITKAQDELNADLIVFPELAITGYPPEDLLLRNNLYKIIRKTLQNLCEQTKNNIDIILGYPQLSEDCHFNAAIWLRKGKLIANYQKQKIPNYDMFDECRYFIPGSTPTIVEIKNINCAIIICEDIWHPEPIAQAKSAGAQCILCLNASPYCTYKHKKRLEIVKQRAKETNLPILYVNLIGGQDGLVFDGNSFAINKNGDVCCQADAFQEQLLPIDIDQTTNITLQSLPQPKSNLANIYQALITGVRDYVVKNNFPGVLIGLSGGIDSALTLAIAVDALGADKVTAILMPSPYTADISIADAKTEAENLQVKYHIIPIESVFTQFKQTLIDFLTPNNSDITTENLQARIRGTLLMALANKTNNLVLTTGNKSEMAVGYATLYGDMAGGFCVLKDVLKTQVYQLANYRNSISSIIPQRTIDRPPSAELAPNQTDQDLLPPYAELDKIITLFVEEEKSIDEIIMEGFTEPTVKRIVKMIQNSEHKRRQAAPGTRITKKIFSRDWRYPITSKYPG